MVEKVTSYSDAAGTSIENEIANVYNGFAQLVAQYQQHAGAVVTLSSPRVQYAYADGSANTIRATSVTYPDGAVLEYRYDDEAADALSRVRTLRFDLLDVCRYDYLGLGIFVRTDYLEPQVRLDYATGSGANPYAGLDRFGRVVDQLWRNYDSATDVVRIKHGYDRSSNRLYREDAVAASFGKAFDELYRYDGLDRLVDFARGNLVDGNTAIESPDWSQDWKLDAVGNWNGFEQQVVDDPAKWLDQQRETNKANEITEISRTVGAEWATPAYDANGNMTSLPRWNAPATSWRAMWDAWNRLVKLEEPDGSGWQDLQEHIYDGSNRRILRRNYISGALSETRRYLYSDRWQAVEEGVFDGSAFDPERQYVYGQRYVDDVVLRDRDSDLGGSFDERFYAMQDANWNVVALCDADADVQRRYTYLPYGEDTGYEGDFAPHSGANYLWTRRFASYEFDIDTELCLARHRWYDPRLGTWISRDPVRHIANDPSLYRYTLSEPINAIDPNGTHKITFAKCCTAAQQTTIVTAWESAQSAASNAADAILNGVLNPDFPVEGRLVIYKKLRLFFEEPETYNPTKLSKTSKLAAATIARIYDVLNKTADGMASGAVTVYCCGNSCDGKKFAYESVPRIYGSSSIVFCPKFFLPIYTARDRAALAFHEATHKWAYTKDVSYMLGRPTATAVDSDLADGYESGLLSESDLARNASTYENYLWKWYLK